MSFVRTFENFTPPPRYDGDPFTTVLIQESALRDSGYSTIDTITIATGPGISPTGNDADPSAPATRDLTTDSAALDPGWYRLVWRDAALDTFTTEPVYFPNPAGDLTTLEAVRRFMQKSATDTAQDDEIGYMITAASDAIMRHCQREFAPPATAETRTFEYAGGSYLDLAPYDLRTVTSIEIDTDEATPGTLDTDEYRLYPNPNPLGVYTALRLQPQVTNIRGRWNQRLLEITGDWGFASVPPAAERACVITTATWIRRDVTAYESTLGPEGEEVVPRSLPMSAVDLLAPLKRETYA